MARAPTYVPALQLTTLDEIDDAIRQDFELTEPDKHVFAHSLVVSKRRSGKRVAVWPKEADLAASITQLSVDLTIKGAPSIVITINDPIWRLMDSGFFDVDQDGRLDNMDVNYPDGSRYWWRLHQFSPQDDKSIQLTFIPWAVSALMDLHGPVKVNRAKRTRAEFFKSLIAKIPIEPDRPAPEFYSKQLDVRQPIGTGLDPGNKSPRSSSKSAHGKAAKTVGLGANTKGLTCRGSPLSSSQRDVATTILRVGDQLQAPGDALSAAIYAAMGESNLSPNNTFQYSGATPADTATEAHAFFMGTGPFGNGGAIHLANTGHPPTQIANACEVNAVYIASGGSSTNPNAPGDSYARQSDPPTIAEARAIVTAGGGGSGGTGLQIETTQPYYFQINPGEDFWTGMNRLAQEVNWELIVDGSRFYYDSDMTLIRQKVAAVIDRDGPNVLSWHYDWDNRHVVTEMAIEIIAEKFEFHSGEVLICTSFGPGSLGSTARPDPLPGRWLITEIQRNVGDAFGTFTLDQPTPPTKEPAPTTTVTNVGVAKGGKISQQLANLPPRSAEACYKAAEIMSGWGIPYSQSQRTLVAHPPSADCSSSTGWMLWQAGFTLPGGINKAGQWPPVSGDYVNWGDPGPGQMMTLWCNADHIFTEFHIPALGHMQFNTSPGPGPQLIPWGQNGAADAASGSFTARHPPGL